MLSTSACVRPRPTVLIVDDEADFTTSLAGMLETRGYDTTTANTGADALRLAAITPPDIALLDLRLPDINGLELLSRIRSLSPTTEVVIITGHAALSSATKAMTLGAFAYIEKPCDNDRLFLTLEQALARRAERAGATLLVEALLHSSLPAAVIEIDNGRLLASTPALVHLLAGDEHQSILERLPVSDATHRDEVAGHMCGLNAARQTIIDLPLHLETTGTHWFELHATPIPNWPNRALVLLLDCDARHRAAWEGIRARASFEAIFENLAAGIMVIDSFFVVRQANPAIARALGFSPEALVGRRCHEILHQRITPCDRHGEVCPIATSLASGATSRALHRHRDAAGNLRHIEVTVAPLHDEDGTTASFVAMFTDLTDLEAAHEETRAQAARLAQLNRELISRQRECETQAEELNAANIRLRELSRAKDEFVSTVSHELRTPLTALSESLNLIAEAAGSSSCGDRSTLLSVAIRNCRRLAELINDLLDFSRIEAGRMQANPQKLDISSLINEVCDTFTPGAREKGLQLEHVVPAGLFVRADERLIHRTLCNLVSNAVKFTQQGSIRIYASSSEDEVVISVADTGIGIPQAEQTHVFERFFQYHRPGKERPPGTGLGLALCKELVELNGGRIWFESHEGKGSTFYFTLPVSP